MRRIARLIGFIIFCLIFLIFAILFWPVWLFTSRRTRHRFFTRLIQIWARILLRMIGINVAPHGLDNVDSRSHYLLVGNHQSYLDIVIIASIFPTLFVAKWEMRQWPILGWLAGLSGTIFVDRKETRSGVICAYRASRLLRNGISVQVFPESTTSDGTQVLPFKALFFTSAMRAQALVLPLTINFRIVNGRRVDDLTRDLMCWYGEMNFLHHFWDLLRMDSAEVSLMIHEPIKPSRMQRAKIIAQAAQQKVISGFDSDQAAAKEGSRVEEQIQIEKNHSTDFIIGALLFSLLASNQSETVSEMIPSNES
jgi:1-acyl-sn-glycerol-3-phosphate acyltransferase